MIFYLENSQKALGSEYIGLKNSEFTSALEQKERVLKDKIAQDPELVKSVGSAFKDKEKAMKLYAKNYDKLVYRYIAGNTLPKLALSMAFYATETLKPDKDRIKGYHDSQLEEWKYINFSPAPIYNDLEEVMLQSDLELALEKLGADDEAVKEVLEGKTPAERAKELISGTKLQSVEVRKQLIEGGIEAMKKSDDPLIKMALKLAPILHKEIKWQEKEIEPMVIPASEKIADAKFKIYGKTIYPDATFTLRMSYGTVKGYEMNGTMAPPFTTFYGLYDRYHGFEGEGDWAITEKVLNARNKVDLSTPINFVSDNDITGGNSGSPIVNKKGEVVGLAFDGNIESLPGRFIYDGKANRTVSVHSAGIIESIKNIYGAEKLAKEILGK